jgi:TonB family protein
MTRAVFTAQLTAIAFSLVLLSPGAHAQSDASKRALERAQKQADAVFSWIKINAEKGAPRQPPAQAAAAPAPAPAPVARKAAPAPAPAMAAAPRPAPAAIVAQANIPTAPAPASFEAPAAASIAASPEPEADLARNAMLVASASPSSAPASPLAVAAQAAEPPAPPPEEEAEVPLKLLHRVNPSIPPQLQRQTFRDAFARVKFVVAPDGKVMQVESMKATNNRLAAAAIDAVKQWRFAPIPEAREAAIEFAFNNVDD